MSAEETPGERLAYRLITGPDDRSFCERVSAALADGYVLHGGPALTASEGSVVAAQAVILPHAIAASDAAVAHAVTNLDYAGEGHA
jgi:hypothetical protein